ncbi:MAG: PepSY-associated TM helix domain-containing protein [Planctomycetales bacterium]|nr:PepSY-associated TM helix domain-containing protein [Planctomycetales bacterium]
MNDTVSAAKRLYSWTRRLHFYFGLFISPFILVFSVSTIILNHSWHSAPQESTLTVPMPIDASLSGAQLVTHVVDHLKLQGEVVGNGVVRDGKTMIVVMRPGVTRRIVVNTVTGQAEVTRRTFGFLDILRYLHVNPGPHKPTRWVFGKLWGWVADTTVCLTLFVTTSGAILWLALKSERRMGLLAIVAGSLTFSATVYALLF